jgi:hypothetical protein
LPTANVTAKGNVGSGIGQCAVIVTNTFTAGGSINLTQSATGCLNMGVKQYTGSGLYLTQ